MSGSWRSSAAGRPQTSQAAGPSVGRRDRDVAVRAVPGRDAVAPPQLARHVPVADVGQPVLPGLLEALREDPGPARSRVASSARSRERLGPDEPLGLEARLDDVVAALAAADDHLVRRGAPTRSPRASRSARIAGPRLVAVEPVVGACRSRRSSRRRRGSWRRQAVAQAGLVVVVVVGRRDLDRAGPERRVDDRVGDDRHVALDERDAHQRARRAPRSARRRGGPRRRCRRGSSPGGSSRR